MLKQLSLQHFVLVAALELDMSSGFTVLTGETGAGKSILIDALQLALGARVDMPVVREGAAKAQISALFSFDQPPDGVAVWLEQAGIELDHSMELLLRRSIDAQGKSRGWINGVPVTIGQLRELGEFLVEIHGQHAWQGLSKPERVRALLDAYGRINTDALLPLWQQWQHALELRQTAQARLADAQQERERLTWQINELEKLSPQENEWDALNNEHERLSHAQMLMDCATEALNLLSEDEANANDRLGQALSALEKAALIDSELAQITEVLMQAQALASDAAHSLHGWLRHADLEPERLAQLDSRLSQWLALARRYRHAPEELPALLIKWRNQLQAIEHSVDIAALEEAEAAAYERWFVLAQDISMQRKRIAPKLSKVITKAMQGLGMPGGAFQVEVVPLERPMSYGLDRVEFLVAGHAGVELRPVGKVASGGELSRLALAIAVTTSQLGHTPTLIFDEVDSGIGGSVGLKVGTFLRSLGQNRQVLAVTHLPQVAASAHQHLVVSKQTIGQSTQSQIHVVDGQARVAEIARMLGGDAKSSTGLAHAQEMITLAQQKPLQ